jgi:hypothetical protein
MDEQKDHPLLASAKIEIAAFRAEERQKRRRVTRAASYASVLAERDAAVDEITRLRATVGEMREWIEKHQHAYDTGRCPECDYSVADYHPEFQPTHSETCSVPRLLAVPTPEPTDG